MAKRMYTTWEFAKTLERRGFPQEVVQEAVAFFLERGYLDDEAYMRAYIEERRRVNPRGYFALRHELKMKGIPPSLLESLREMYPLEAEMEDVLGLLSSWEGRGVERESLWRRLRTRGFAEEAIEWGWSLFTQGHRP
ncbi:MAG: regulatory protein RecX [Candidatus Caldatribacteriaceae bacterium]